MDMDQLAHFQCVAELRNFTHAAERLSMSQPALSRSIQRLEEELGQPLFERKPRSVDLTDAGQLFQSRAEQILLILEVERTSQLVMVQELVSLGHGVSLIPAMAKKLDQSNRRVYRSLCGTKPTRTVAAVWNPYRFQSRLLREFREHLRAYSEAFISYNEPG